MTAISTVDEPMLDLPRPRRFWRSLFGVLLAVSICLAVVGGSMLAAASLRKPAKPIVVVKGIMASKRDFFEDDKVKQLLLDHQIRVEVTPRGSHEVALEVINQETDQYDFAFPSGQAAVDLIKNHRDAIGAYHQEAKLFTSPIVLASFRGYADILAENGIATAYPGQDTPLYYTLNTAGFMELGERGETWNSIQNGEQKRISNGNRVLARTAGVCRSNSAATYFGLLAFVNNGGKPPGTETDVNRLAQRIQPLVMATGMAESDLFPLYVTPDGKSLGPIVVVYEHQFLAYQVDHQRRTGIPDTDRVLLYPKEELQTDPEFISLRREGGADQLAELLATDPALRERMLELGYRVLDGGQDVVGTKQLFKYLTERGVPAPERTDFTRADLPRLDLLEKLIHAVDRCPT